MFPSFRLNFASDFFELLLVTFHQAEIIVVKHLTQGRNIEAWMGVEPSTLNDAPNHSATLQGCLAATKNFQKRKLDTGELADRVYFELVILAYTALSIH